jgi:protein-disulfide isomerase
MQEENIQQNHEPVIEFEPAPKKLSIPAAIILGSLIIAAAILVGPLRTQAPLSVDTTAKNTPEKITIEPITTGDHIFGDTKKAKVFVVEFSDLECPFCKVFHATMNKVIDHYDGKVAWVYRQFPIDNLHKKARTEAHASECVAELGGNDAFWIYIDRIFTTTGSNDKLDLALLPQFANDLGIDTTAFTTCMESNRHAEKIAKMEADGIAAGLQGTPYSVIVTKDGKTVALNGNQPYEEILKLIDPLLK